MQFLGLEQPLSHQRYWRVEKISDDLSGGVIMDDDDDEVNEGHQGK